MYKNDEEVLQGLRSNRQDALKYVYKTVYPSVLSYVKNNSGSEDEAQDIFQEAMIVFYQKATKVDFTLSAAIKTFVFAVAKNLWLKKLRDSKKHKYIGHYENMLSDNDDEKELNEHQEKVKATLVNFLEELGDPCRKLLVLYYYEKRSMEEISSIMKYSNSNSAKNQKYKCLQRLKKVVPGDLLVNL